MPSLTVRKAATGTCLSVGLDEDDVFGRCANNIRSAYRYRLIIAATVFLGTCLSLAAGDGGTEETLPLHQ